jgi:enoyl-CoA hydratase/carnithine racemase
MTRINHASQEPYLLRQDHGAITTLILNRPQHYNALCQDLLSELQTTLDEIKVDENVNVVIIAGNGPAFCAGHDLKELRSHTDQAAHQALFMQCSRIMLTINQLPQPVIARVHGIATAAGCQLVAACDLAVAADKARFATSGINVGLFCATPGVAVSRNLSRKHALKLLLTGDFIDAQEAFRQGLVNNVVELATLDDAVQRLAESICAKPSRAVADGKAMFYKQLTMDLENAYGYASEVMACGLASQDAQEGIDAFIHKRKPQWRHR